MQNALIKIEVGGASGPFSVAGDVTNGRSRPAGPDAKLVFLFTGTDSNNSITYSADVSPALGTAFSVRNSSCLWTALLRLVLLTKCQLGSLGVCVSSEDNLRSENTPLEEGKENWYCC